VTFERTSAVGGLVYPYRRVPLARGRFSWPFARLTLGPAEIILGPRGWLQRVVKPTVIPYQEVTRVERIIPPALLRYAEGLRFRSDRDEWDRLYFSSFPGRVHQLVAALRNRGVEVR
jgi:hypothetical protein